MKADTVVRSLSRLWGTAVLWSWFVHLFRLAGVLAVVPLLTRLPDSDFGFYYLLVSIVAITPLVDFGFAASVERNVSYAMGGAQSLSARGVPEAGGAGAPNFAMLWKLVHTARSFYRGLTVVLLIGLGLPGTWIVSGAAAETAHPQLAWLAWAVALLNAAFEVYSSWWNVVLRGMNRVVAGSRILCLGQALKLGLSCGLLLAGGGVLSIFAAGLISSSVVRALSRWSVLRELPREPGPKPERREVMEVLRTLWPNTWRVGLQWLGNYLAALGVMLICKERFGLSGAGQYGFSLNIATLIQGMALVWVSVKWPLIGQMRSRMELDGIRRVLWSRIWLGMGTFVALSLAALGFTPLLVDFGILKKEVLPAPWFLLLLVSTFLDMKMIVWTTFLSTENRVPSLWPVTATNVIIVALVWLLAEPSLLGLGAFACAPLMAGALFNYWFWPIAGARNLKSSWLRYMFVPPDRRNAPRDRSAFSTPA